MVGFGGRSLSGLFDYPSECFLGSLVELALGLSAGQEVAGVGELKGFRKCSHSLKLKAAFRWILRLGFDPKTPGYMYLHRVASSFPHPPMRFCKSRDPFCKETSSHETLAYSFLLTTQDQRSKPCPCPVGFGIAASDLQASSFRNSLEPNAKKKVSWPFQAKRPCWES